MHFPSLSYLPYAPPFLLCFIGHPSNIWRTVQILTVLINAIYSCLPLFLLRSPCSHHHRVSEHNLIKDCDDTLCYVLSYIWFLVNDQRDAQVGRLQVGLPTCRRHGHRHRATATRGCIDTICLSWWWARCARNM